MGSLWRDFARRERERCLVADHRAFDFARVDVALEQCARVVSQRFAQRRAEHRLVDDSGGAERRTGGAGLDEQRPADACRGRPLFGG
jgi:hypothetical protein